MLDQATSKKSNRRPKLRKVVKKHKKKDLLTMDIVRIMYDTPLNPETLQRHARQYFVTQKLGSRLILSHPYTDIHGRHIKTVVLDFSLYKKTGYIQVQPFKPVNDNNYGVTAVNYDMALHVKTHRELYKKLLFHNLL